MSLPTSSASVADDRDLMRAHVAALFAQDPRGRMTYVNEPGGRRAPRFFLGRTRLGVEWWVRDDVDDPQLLREIHTLCEGARSREDEPLAPEWSTPYEEVLARSAPIQSVWSGPAFSFPSRLAPSARSVPITEANAFLLRRHLAPWLPDIHTGQPLFALVYEGDAVAICGSVRRTRLAHEAGVETVPEFRGRGFATEAVAAWARAVREAGATPLYSTSWDNVASLALARRLGLRLFGADLHIT